MVMKKFFIVFVIFSFFYVCLHLYIANFISRYAFEQSKIRLFFLSMCLLSISIVFMRGVFYKDILTYFYLAAFMWMGFVLVTAFVFSLVDFIGIFLKINFKYLFYSACVLSILIVIYSVVSSLKFPEEKEIVVESNKISRDYVFYFISDLHIDFPFKRSMFCRIMKKLNEGSGEFIVIGGDLFDPGFRMNQCLKNISNKKVFFVMGNHEYYYGIDKSKRDIEMMNFKDITSNSLSYGQLNLIGIDDIHTRGLLFDDVKSFIGKNYKEGYFNIIISHQPLYFKEISNEYDVFMLSGHTHCGQIFPFHIFIKIFYPYFCGKYERKNSVIYVSSGAGVWGPQMRFLSQGEIVKVVVKRI